MHTYIHTNNTRTYARVRPWYTPSYIHTHTTHTHRYTDDHRFFVLNSVYTLMTCVIFLSPCFSSVPFFFDDTTHQNAQLQIWLTSTSLALLNQLGWFCTKVELNSKIRAHSGWMAGSKKGMPLGQVPVLEIDGKAYYQSKAILRLLARKTISMVPTMKKLS